MKPKLGDMIKVQRKKLHMSIETLAKKLNCHRTHLSSIENFHYLPSLKLIEKMAKELQCTKLIDLYFAEKAKKLAKAKSEIIRRVKG